MAFAAAPVLRPGAHRGPGWRSAGRTDDLNTATLWDGLERANSGEAALKQVRADEGRQPQPVEAHQCRQGEEIRTTAPAKMRTTLSMLMRFSMGGKVALIVATGAAMVCDPGSILPGAAFPGLTCVNYTRAHERAASRAFPAGGAGCVAARGARAADGSRTERCCAFPSRPAVPRIPLLLEGTVRVSQTSPGGREIVLYHVEPGQGCLLSGGCLLGHSDYGASGVAETDVTPSASAGAIPRAPCRARAVPALRVRHVQRAPGAGDAARRGGGIPPPRRAACATPRSARAGGGGDAAEARGRAGERARDREPAAAPVRERAGWSSAASASRCAMRARSPSSRGKRACCLLQVEGEFLLRRAREGRCRSAWRSLEVLHRAWIGATIFSTCPDCMSLSAFLARRMGRAVEAPRVELFVEVHAWAFSRLAEARQQVGDLAGALGLVPDHA